MSTGWLITLIALGVVLLIGVKVWWLIRWFKRQEAKESRPDS